MVLSTKNDMPEKDVTVDSNGIMINPATKENQALMLDQLIALQKPALNLALINSAINPYPNRFFRFAFGRRDNIGNTDVDLWEGPTDTYVFPTAPMQMKIVSTNAGDSQAGAGARQITYAWLDGDYILHVDTVLLNGTTPVTLPFTDMFRINFLHVSVLGSIIPGSLGDISIKNMAETVTYGIIKTGGTIARQAIATVPLGFNSYVSHWQASSGSTGGNHFTQIAIKTNTVGDGFYPGIFFPLDEVGSQDSSDQINFEIPIRVFEKSDIKISARSDASNAQVTSMGAVMGWFELKP